MPRAPRKQAPRIGPQSVRIIGGQFRRTPITVVDAPGLRPTPDRVRETVFNWLSHLWDTNFDDKSVLDPFAGSGAMGFEAASRGASRIVMVETERRAIFAMTTLRDKLDATNIELIHGDGLAAMRRLTGAKFDVIFLDPPFGEGKLDKVWPLLPGVLAQDGLVYVESEAAVNVPEGFALVRQDTAGAVHFALLERIPAAT
ncbi:16S rRNA (guanine(966)-N(2))-methyltransferase RsmD [Pigmentiphaga aceris]|uniref:16S rRNA (Guanine(966)-N(2))-methyltransferase RsmD n=1 Tax=Pigmentiphaga aceris TaxID=1940612 RepID=A0A5C0B2N9_9BURK|nr:16S rRNA (guanine(966)-N(2))-methyltransferase RsmD [Pigmentiphaga aceris]QEI08822.1 16S rRNA (guanine(966)-N(2))-methyltransferase RsmD [Pigmentiphaga aceris]